ncbi:retrovirus-related pol polyprotein from transposon TNT 1-94 [Tanacetum coccineum]
MVVGDQIPTSGIRAQVHEVLWFVNIKEQQQKVIDRVLGSSIVRRKKKQLVVAPYLKVQTQNLIYYHPARDREQHSVWKLFKYREDSNEAAFAVAEAEKIYAHESLTFNNTVACEMISKWKTGLKDDMDARSDVYVLSNGCKKCSDDSCVYYRSYAPGEYIYLLLYVDDMLIACKSKAEIGSTKSLLKKVFNMKELLEAKKILGMEIIRDRSRKILRVSQSGYVFKILNNFRIDNGKSVQMPLGGHFKLSLKDFPVGDCDVEMMSKVAYANAIGSLM